MQVIETLLDQVKNSQNELINGLEQAYIKSNDSEEKKQISDILSKHKELQNAIESNDIDKINEIISSFKNGGKNI